MKHYFDQAMQRLHSGDSDAAVSICAAALLTAPDDIDLLTLHGVALLDCRKPHQAEPPLRRAVELAPRFPRARENLGQALLQLGRPDEAIEHLQQAAALEPGNDSVRMKLAHALARMGDGERADTVFEEAFRLAPDRGKLAEATEHLRHGRIKECKQIAEALLASNADDVNALRLLAKVAGEEQRWPRAERLLKRALSLAPEFHDARLDLATALKQLDQLDDALACAEDTIARAPQNAFAYYVYASMLAVCGRQEQALAAYRRAIELRSFHPAAYVGMGHLLKTLGQTDEGIAAYRKAIEQRPNFGEVYWSLANLKTFRFTADEVADMERRLADEPLDDDARVHFMFTLGKAFEDQQSFDRAFEYYAEAAALQRMRISYDPVETEQLHERICEVFTAEYLKTAGSEEHAGPTPIFIVGLPRSGSTLIEQILASHSMVAGTAELPDVGRVSSSLAKMYPGETYPEAVRHLDAAGWHELGKTYLARTERHRQGLPFFTDKMPNNFSAVGFIHMMLPGAKIIDARRHPLDSCFGTFKQHFAHGQTFSYDLDELGEFYLGYRRLMRHWHQVLPGRVLELRYEDMVADQETQTRRLLDYCGLPFEENCLRFYETERAVRTASSEQVRRPIYATSVNHWQNFRDQLAPLIEILGEELADWDQSK
ncbi:MAG: sulfotransferase [Gammaproteobacteria bacterium]|nr:sulfotransferase [Gammaproteobacteria bacterium]